jgi:hypothetical protein
LLLVNLTHEPIRGALRFLDSAGIASGSEVSYSLPADGSQRLKTSSASEVSRVGSLQVNPAPGDASPSVAALFSFDSAGVTVSQMGIPGTPADRAFRLYTEISGEPGAVDSLRTGVAIANPSRTDQLVSFELFQLNGTPLSVAGKAAIPADGQTALFVDQIPGLEGMPKPFRGVLRVSSASPIAVTGLRGHYNERREFLLAAIVPAGESTDDSGELFLPHLVDGGGYSTQLVLFNRTSDPVSGNIFFFNQAGQPINLLPPFIP